MGILLKLKGAGNGIVKQEKSILYKP